MQRKRGKGDFWLLLLLLLGLGGWGGEPPETPDPKAPDRPDPPKCPPGHHAAWSERRRRWDCVKDEPDAPDTPDPPLCNVGEHPEWDDAAKQWRCVADEPKGPGVIVRPPAPECAPGEHPVWSARRGQWDCVRDEPGPDPGLDDPKIFNPFPTPASYYPVKGGDSEFARAREYVASCLYLAAIAHGDTHQEALAFATANQSAAARMAAVAFWSDQPENDRDYGTYRFTKCKFTGEESGCTWPGKCGRGIRFVFNGGNTEARMRAGQPMRRTMPLGSPGQGPTAESACGPGDCAYPVLWLPEPDYGVLYSSKGLDWLPSKISWSDGVSRFRPPPAFRALSWQDLSGSGRKTWGCAPNEVTF